MGNPADDQALARAAWNALQDAGGLAGIPELQERWGTPGRPLSRRRVYDYLADPAFPEPVLERGGGGKLWLTADADRWMDEHAERAGRRGPKPRHLQNETPDAR
jgi:predicted DNA-binding transcriptional regulator AlpA